MQILLPAGMANGKTSTGLGSETAGLSLLRGNGRKPKYARRGGIWRLLRPPGEVWREPSHFLSQRLCDELHLPTGNCNPPKRRIKKTRQGIYKRVKPLAFGHSQEIRIGI